MRLTEEKTRGGKTLDLPNQSFTVFWYCILYGDSPFESITHRGRIKKEEKAKVVAVVWWTELIQFLAALAILNQDNIEEQDEFILFFKSSLRNSSYSSNHPSALHNSWRGKDLHAFCPPNSSDDLCLFFFLLLYGITFLMSRVVENPILDCGYCCGLKQFIRITAAGSNVHKMNIVNPGAGPTRHLLRQSDTVLVCYITAIQYIVCQNYIWTPRRKHFFVFQSVSLAFNTYTVIRCCIVATFQIELKKYIFSYDIADVKELKEWFCICTVIIIQLRQKITSKYTAF